MRTVWVLDASKFHGAAVEVLYKTPFFLNLKGLSPIAYLMPEGGEVNKASLDVQLPLFWPIFSASGIVFRVHDLVWVDYKEIMS